MGQTGMTKITEMTPLQRAAYRAPWSGDWAPGGARAHHIGGGWAIALSLNK